MWSWWRNLPVARGAERFGLDKAVQKPCPELKSPALFSSPPSREQQRVFKTIFQTVGGVSRCWFCSGENSFGWDVVSSGSFVELKETQRRTEGVPEEGRWCWIPWDPTGFHRIPRDPALHSHKPEQHRHSGNEFHWDRSRAVQGLGGNLRNKQRCGNSGKLLMCGFKPSATADCAARSVQGHVLHQLFPVLGPSTQEGPGGAGTRPGKGTELRRGWSAWSS